MLNECVCYFCQILHVVIDFMSQSVRKHTKQASCFVPPMSRIDNDIMMISPMRIDELISIMTNSTSYVGNDEY